MILKEFVFGAPEFQVKLAFCSPNTNQQAVEIVDSSSKFFRALGKKNGEKFCPYLGG